VSKLSDRDTHAPTIVMRSREADTFHCQLVGGDQFVGDIMSNDRIVICEDLRGFPIRAAMDKSVPQAVLELAHVDQRRALVRLASASVKSAEVKVKFRETQTFFGSDKLFVPVHRRRDKAPTSRLDIVSANPPTRAS